MTVTVGPIAGGRVCACGCLRNIEHLRANAKRMPGCQWVREKEMEAARSKLRTKKRDRTRKSDRNIVRVETVETPRVLCARGERQRPVPRVRRAVRS